MDRLCHPTPCPACSIVSIPRAGGCIWLDFLAFLYTCHVVLQKNTVTQSRVGGFGQHQGFGQLRVVNRLDLLVEKHHVMGRYCSRKDVEDLSPAGIRLGDNAAGSASGQTIIHEENPPALLSPSSPCNSIMRYFP